MTAPEGETRITLAVLKRDIEELTTTVRSLTDEVRKANQCNADITTRVAVVETKVSAQAGEIDKLRQRDNNGTIANAILAVIAGAIGWLKP